MEKRKMATILSIILCLTLILSACGSNGQDTSSNQNSSKNQNDSGTDTTDQGTDVDAPADPLGKYDPPITISAAQAHTDDLQNSTYQKFYKEELGINIEYDWIVDGSSYSEKLNLTIASGDLPDVFSVDVIQLKQLVEAGLVEDITEVLDQYASPFLNEVMEKMTLAGKQLDSARFEGKLYAFPSVDSPFDRASMLWLRTDWLENLNLPEPKTLEDVIKLSEAFTNNDPDGNNENDTYGLAITKELISGNFNLTGFMNGYHAYPGAWVEDATGNLVYGSVQPEVKQALVQIQKMYSVGEMDREFGVKDFSKALESIERHGLFFGPIYPPVSGMQGIKDEHPEMEWKPIPIPSIDAQLVKPQSPAARTNFYVVRKGVEHPEALVKLLNMFLEIDSKDDEYRDKFIEMSDGSEDAFQSLVVTYSPTSNVDSYISILDALESNDPSELRPNTKENYERILAHQAGNKENMGTNWAFNKIFGPEGALSVTEYYIDNELLMMDAFKGAATPSMGEKMGTLNSMEIEVFTKIIMGAASIDEFDKFVNDWHDLGGEQITSEVNEWAANR